MEKKIRIQKFDEEGRLVDDRMVSQDLELSSGPKEIYNNLLRIEFTFESKSDVPLIQEYLDKLVGNLPISTKEKKKKNPKIMDSPQQREDLLDEMLGSYAENQDVFIRKLREEGFVFIMTDFLETFDFPELNIKSKHKEKYQWMILQLKEARNPKADKYDPMLVFGIQLLPEHDEKIVVYLNGEFKKLYKIPIPPKPQEVFKKTQMMKFPHYMIDKERDKFRAEIRLYQNDPDRELSKFFIRYKEYVKNVPEIPNGKKKQND